MFSRFSWGTGLLIAGVLLTSIEAGAATRTQTQEVVYGRDNRTDVMEHPDEALRTLARESIVTLVNKVRVDAANPNDVRFLSTASGVVNGLCEDERFRDQPTAGFCSGTLIAPDLVMTAGHCVSNSAFCEKTFFVFAYVWDRNGLRTVTTDQIYSCRRVVAQANTSDSPTRDYAVIQLDRPARNFTPANVAPGRPTLRTGQQLVMIGSGSGLPLKIDDGGRVRDPGPSWDTGIFKASVDAFGGNSGSGVFDANTLEMVGMLVAGEEDYVLDGGCYRVNQCPEDGCRGESVVYLDSALAALCANATDQVLCGTNSRCGDGFCGYDESHESCPADCSPPVCGDGICDVSEWQSCPSDCAPEVPESWTCDPSYYDARDGCDCECGAIDPDCAYEDQDVYGCGLFGTCTEAGLCEGGFLSDCSDCAAANTDPRSGPLYSLVLLALVLVMRRRVRERLP